MAEAWPRQIKKNDYDNHMYSPLTVSHLSSHIQCRRNRYIDCMIHETGDGRQGLLAVSLNRTEQLVANLERGVSTKDLFNHPTTPEHYLTT